MGTLGTSSDQVLSRKDLVFIGVIQKWFDDKFLVEVSSVVKGELSLRHIELTPYGFGMIEGRLDLGMYAVRGDVSDLTRPLLFFVDRETNSDGTDLLLSDIRAIQPLESLPFFRALWSSDQLSAVEELLANADDGILIERCLEFVAGGSYECHVLPWPFSYCDTLDSPIVNEARASKHVWRLSKHPGRTSYQAVAVYAHLLKKLSIPKLRTLLRSEDSDMRVLAVGLLIRLGDTMSRPLFEKAVSSPKCGCGYIAHGVVAELAKVGEMWSGPALIQFLEAHTLHPWWRLDPETNLGYCARKALRRLTGCVFPYDVAKSRVLFAKFEAERDRLVAEVSRDAAPPVEAEILRSESKSEESGRIVYVLSINIVNRSSENVCIASRPSCVAAIWSHTDVSNRLDWLWWHGLTPVHSIVLPSGCHVTIEQKVPAKIHSKGAELPTLRLCFWERIVPECWLGEIDVR